MTADRLREQICEFLRFSIPETNISFVYHNDVVEDGYHRVRIDYMSQDEDLVPAFLLLSQGEGPFPAVLIHHQHHGQ